MGPNQLKGTKICYIAGTLGMGGAERQLYMILQAALLSGAEVALICLTEGEYWEKPIKELGVEYHSLGNRGNRLARLLKIRAIVSKNKTHIIHSHHFYTNLYAAVAARLIGAKSVGSSRSDIKVEAGAHGILGKWCLKWPDYMVFNSMRSLEQAKTYGLKSASVFYLPNALDLNKFVVLQKEEPNLNDRLVILSVGRLISLKRFELFLELVAKLREKIGTKIKGQLIGDGPLGPELRKLANAKGLGNDDFEFVQHTSSPERYYQNAHIFVLCSEYEGTPNVVLEAMASGPPVIVTKVGNLPYFINDGENGLFFDGTIEDLVAKSVQLLENDERCKSISTSGRQTIEDRFSFGSLQTKLAGIYTKITF